MSNHLFLAYESCKDRFDEPITYNDFLELTKDWEVIPVYVGGECAGAILDRINIYTLASSKSTISDGLIIYFKTIFNKSIYKMVFVDRLAKYGELFTGVMANNDDR